MNADGNSTWLRRANNYISEAQLQELGGRSFAAQTIAFPKVGATIYTNKKRILASAAVVDNNVMGVTVTDEACSPEFLFFWFQHIELATLSSPGTVPSITSSRVKAQEVILPPREEQNQIVALLWAVQQAIERQERLIALTAEFKRALMHALFTEGTRRERRKQTEVGPVPESWRVEPLGEHLVAAQYGLSVKGAADGATPILRMTNQVDGRIIPNDLQMVTISKSDLLKFKLEPGDVLFNRTNSFELVGRTAIFELAGEYVFASYLIRLRTQSERLRSAFLNHYFNWDAAQDRLKGIASRAVSQSNISASRLRAFLVPLPSPEEQDEIIRCVDQVDRVRSVRLRQLDVLQGLFRTLLYQLMTAQVRVRNLDLSALETAREPSGVA
jgi:type I restriction enzyme S subunit